eukprot:CAMPEP_0173393732 /NCGR_PEP_ID=MMETSP1356-20130122/22277_1 /TAXON_ID=77927 ORGANISM="Hemiselmis virescens, Strain PCC157" /NCGR_SAMPLE_ID=MMETSP1356 /ASSEMBLY_ACC=CAM_ASM_000847 /LENGTH=349 /DNA_ID=CAMNT_0014351795 /DNA_START=147 /DNA_END=1193 /DNA_ORIENTATION=-
MSEGKLDAAVPAKGNSHWWITSIGLAWAAFFPYSESERLHHRSAWIFAVLFVWNRLRARTCSLWTHLGMVTVAAAVTVPVFYPSAVTTGLEFALSTALIIDMTGLAAKIGAPAWVIVASVLKLWLSMDVVSVHWMMVFVLAYYSTMIWFQTVPDQNQLEEDDRAVSEAWKERRLRRGVLTAMVSGVYNEIRMYMWFAWVLANSLLLLEMEEETMSQHVHLAGWVVLGAVMLLVHESCTHMGHDVIWFWAPITTFVTVWIYMFALLFWVGSSSTDPVFSNDAVVLKAVILKAVGGSGHTVLIMCAPLLFFELFLSPLVRCIDAPCLPPNDAFLRPNKTPRLKLKSWPGTW